jgi:hypothetical protein
MSADLLGSYQTAVARWAGIGPYYAMFPLDFAFQVVDRFTTRGQSVLDPFAGRGSSIFAAAAQGRSGVGIEINPVGWLYGRVKLNPAPEEEVLRRLHNIEAAAEDVHAMEIERLPEFFRVCFAPRILQFLLAARAELDWQNALPDATLMALLLVYLHGKREASLSNQMRQGKAMGPDYSVRWWRERGMQPPEVDPVAFMVRRIGWRFKKGIPDVVPGSEMLLGDSTQLLRTLGQQVQAGTRPPFQLLFTSPPYYKVTNYHYDQWLRLWLLGGPEQPGGPRQASTGKFESRSAYEDLLRSIFELSGPALAENAAIYVRTDARAFTLRATVSALQEAFPGREQELNNRPYSGQTQTALFGDKSEKPGEVDIVLRVA